MPGYFEGPSGPAQWGWLEISPQKPFPKTVGGAAEEVPVGVGQNAVDGRLSVLSNPRSHGRSFHDGAEPPPGSRDFTGRNFQEQWDIALKMDPAFVFVTGWNEWIAGRFGPKSPFYDAGPMSFVDEFNEEFSRDIEPMVGGHTDDYYYQLAANVRKYKGVAPSPPPASPVTLPANPGSESDWNLWRAAGTAWSDDPFDIPKRDHSGWSFPAEGPASRYTNPGGVNDFVLARASHDAKNLYLYVKTREPIREMDSPRRMSVLLATGEPDSATNQGFDFAINRLAGIKNGAATLERWTGSGWKTITPSLVCAVRGSEMAVTVPRALLGLAAPGPVTVDIKWTDGIDWETDPLNFYRDGDTAPDGRFRYRYIGAQSSNLR